MRFGDINLHLVSDGIYWSDGAGLFGVKPKVDWERIRVPDGLNRVPLETRSLLVETNDQCILVDTGYGDKLSDKERSYIGLEGDDRLLRSLEALEIRPQDVDLVVNTHLHSDHCGGNTRLDEGGRLVPTFPRAMYCVQRLEMAEAMFPNERTWATYLRDNFEPLERAGRLRILDGDTELTREVRVVLTPGHTPGHQCVVIESAGCLAIFLGDVASWPIHMEQLDCIAAYDVQPLVSIETKRQLAQWAVKHRVLLIFEHHPDIAAGYLYHTEQSGRLSLEAVEAGLLTSAWRQKLALVLPKRHRETSCAMWCSWKHRPG
jgi:glyoxylase-like metal-dependent hydrolase (beta-lactamase superfamily II)